MKVELKELRLAGFNIIPLKPNSKVPMIPKISKYFNKHYDLGFPPNCNYAVILGNISGYLVVDTDSPEAEEWVKNNLPITGVMAKTKNGFHRYYKMPADGKVPNTRKVTPPKIGKCDLKSNNSYCVIPPSHFIEGNGNYEWARFEINKVPEFRSEWIHIDNRIASKRSTISLEVSDKKLKEFIQYLIEGDVFISNKLIYVKNAVKVLDKLGLGYTADKTGPMESKTKNNSGYIIIDNYGLSLGSWACGVFFSMKVSVDSQMEKYLKGLNNG